ncbi:MAG: SIMPL domain-containing protein [Allosphingosinicella sp.]
MNLRLLAPLLLACAALPTAGAAAAASETALAPGATRLDVVATGEVARVPNIARISAGVVTAAPTAAAALADNARRMAAVRAALKRAGVADRDIQTSAINLFPDYRQEADGAPPRITGYRASNEVAIRFRDIADSGRILDALVAEGANQINGPTFSIEDQGAAMDEARTSALAVARARAELYARALGKRVTRILAVSESGDVAAPGPIGVRMLAAQAKTAIEPGEQSVTASLTVVFELQ